MAIKKIKKHEMIGSDKLNEIIDEVNKFESASDKANSLIQKGEILNDQNKKIIEEFLMRFSEKVESIPDSLNMMSLLNNVVNGGAFATRGASEEPLKLSVFYGTTQEVANKEAVEGMILIDTITGSVSFCWLNPSTNKVEKKPISSQNFGYDISIDPETLRWKVDGVLTDVSAVGETGPQGQQGLRGIPGQPIELIARPDIEPEPSLDAGVPITTDVYDQIAHMSKAIVWKKKIYAPKITSNGEDGFEGVYELVADFNYDLEILDHDRKKFGDDGASTNYEDYTFYINKDDTGVRAYGPEGPKGDTGTIWYMHLFFSAIPLEVGHNEAEFFAGLRSFNDNHQYLVVVNGSAIEEGVPVFASRPTNETIRRYYDAGKSSEFNLYTISIKPNVLTPKISNVDDGYKLEWQYQQEASLEAIDPVTIKHGKAFEPIRFNTKAQARIHGASSDNEYNTYIIPFGPNNNTEEEDTDYIYTYSSDINDLVYLGKLSGPQGIAGPVGPVGPEGPTGSTGSRGSKHFYYLGAFPSTSFTLLRGEVFNSQGASAQAGDIIIDNKGNLAMIRSMTDLGSDQFELKCIQFANIQGPKGDTGATGATGPKGDTGEKGAEGNSPILKRDESTNYVNWKYINEDETYWRTLFDVDDLKGDKGDKGDTGPRGDTGITGATGAAGPQGIQGPQGNVGPRGDEGRTGLQGPTGPKGEDGKDGKAVNIKGSKTTHELLPTGTQPEGDAYLIGGNLWVYTGSADTSDPLPPAVNSTHNGFTNVGVIQGPKGDAGSQGLQGPEGPQGPQGPQGQEGPQGPQGTQGVQGIQGVKGETGATGATGATGGTGTAGQSITSVAQSYAASSSTSVTPNTFGTLSTAMGNINDTSKYLWKQTEYKSGSVVVSTVHSVAAIKGDRGIQGIQGVTGATGATGATGIGIKGDTGDEGPQGPKGDTGDTGENGSNGLGIAATTTSYTTTINIIEPTSGWVMLGQAMSSFNETNKYLWKLTQHSMSDGSTQYAGKEIIAVYAKGDKGEVGATFSYTGGVLTITTN